MIQKSPAQTPMMAQWHSCKEAAPDTILLFRLGDFYEAFYEDAELLSKELDLTLTKRQEIPMAGVPHHMGETYVDRLVAKGYRVSIAEQLENPKDVKGIVKRGIARIVTPGTVINSSLIQDKEQNYLACVFPLNQSFGLSFLDITTAAFFTFELESEKALMDELSRVQPKELLLPKRWGKEFALNVRPTVHLLESWHFDHQSALDCLLRHFKVQSLDGFGLKGMSAGINAAGALLTYVQEELNLPIEHIKAIQTPKNTAFMHIDQSTQRNLELIRPLHEGQKESTLLNLIDGTKTPMGGRMLRSWLIAPLLDVEKIKERQDRIEVLSNEFSKLLELRRYLGEIRDIERLMMRIETGFASPRDFASLRTSLQQIPLITPFIEETFPDVSQVVAKIESALVQAPPMRLSDGGIFKEGYDGELDELLTIKKDSKSWIANYQIRLRDTLGIKTLKVGYTKAFGYYIEVSKGQSGHVPEHFHRRQTLVNAERFITDELKEFEYKILSADEKIRAIEARLFTELRTEIATFAEPVRSIAQTIAHVDCFASLAKLASEREYVRPLVDTSTTYEVKEGRHPVIEANLEESFIPNDVAFDGKQLALITGPNMAGKSTFIRQAALIAILAQMGSFVPAQSAHIGIIDKVFSRIGASDDLARGQSTFMVEMTETANILHNATERSLVILDEIGRGTSTYDGISIAWAVAEFLLSTPGSQAKTLFATHYFEMTDLIEKYPAAFNLNVAVDEQKNGIVFLHKIQPGMADKSYGIHVARLAGLPLAAIKGAEKKLRELENETPPPRKDTSQLDLFTASEAPRSPILEELETLDPNQMTPLEALQQLLQWKTNAI
ncbi:MAG: DNA mismatch repair protein MutS [Simkaniaceae bacterium]|nr:DNA mismatch repair protein MutS [Candidatus Sacchlamyda saccharinae]